MNLQPMRIKQIYITTLESINSLTKFPFVPLKPFFHHSPLKNTPSQAYSWLGLTPIAKFG